MTAPGVPSLTSGDAPDLAAGNYETVRFDKTVQQFHIRNTDVAGGAVLRFGFKAGADNTDTLDPGESFSLFNIRLIDVVVGSDTAGSTCPYVIALVEQ